MNLNEFHFIRPYWLLALIPATVVMVMLLRHKLSRGNWASVCDAALLPYLLQEKAVHTSRKSLLLGAVMALLAIIALAGPTFQRLPSPVFRNDSALVIALDLSRSMDAEDIKPSRLIRARYKIADLLNRRKDGQTALLVFAGDAFTVTPLTDDTETIASQLEALTTDIMPAQGSQAEAALSLAVQLLQQAGLPKGQILLITDGVDADVTAARGGDDYRLSVLGVGTTDGAPIALPKGGFLKDAEGAIVVPKLDEARLAKLADAGGGVYQTLTTDDKDIETVLADQDTAVPEQEADGENKLLIDLWDDLGPWLVLAVLPLAALSFRRGLLCLAFLVLLPMPESSYALDWQDLWKTNDQQAEEAFAQKQYDRAAELFDNPDWKAAAQYRSDKAQTGKLQAPKTATGFYNQGNVLAKSSRFEEAIAAYDKALAIDPANEDAKYNKKLVEEALKQQKQQQQQNQQNQQQSGKPQDSEKNQQQDQQNPQKDQSGSEQKPEQKDENAEQRNGDSQQEKPEDGKDKESEKAAEQQKPVEEQQAKDASEANKDPNKADPSKQNEASAQPAQPSDETMQANEQWLNRIPDDPAGLLKRKFKYQYGQRRQRPDNKAQNW